MKKEPNFRKQANYFFIGAGLILLFGIIEFNKARELDKGIDVIMTYTGKLLYQLGGSDIVIIAHFIFSSLLLLLGVYFYRKSDNREE